MLPSGVVTDGQRESFVDLDSKEEADSWPQLAKI
jgi:hypothetical protein